MESYSNIAILTLRQPDPAAFHQTLSDIANPAHPKYGKHLTRAELKELVRPHQDSTDAVTSWLHASGIQQHEIAHDGEFINFIATVGQAEEMMDTKFENYQNLNKRSVNKIRTLGYSLPRDLARHVDMVQPTTRFAQIKPEFSQVLKTEVLGKAQTGAKAIQAVNATACNSTITPQCLIDLYNIKGVTPKMKDSGILGVSGFLEQYAQFDDLSKWAAVYRPDFKNASFSWRSVSGGLLTQGACRISDATLRN